MRRLYLAPVLALAACGPGVYTRAEVVYAEPANYVYVVPPERVVVVTREVLVNRGYVVYRVQRAGPNRIIWARRGDDEIVRVFVNPEGERGHQGGGYVRGRLRYPGSEPVGYEPLPDRRTMPDRRQLDDRRAGVDRRFDPERRHESLPVDVERRSAANRRAGVERRRAVRRSSVQRRVLPDRRRSAQLAQL